jgi:Homing endonuclease associated repeat
LRDWTEFVGEAPRMSDWSPVRGGERESQWCRLWKEQHPRWPSASAVVGYHGSWRAALLAAGLPADRAPLELSLEERVEAAQRLHAGRMSVAAIAHELELDSRTIRRYLAASVCGCGQQYVVKGVICQACAQRRAVRRAEWTATEFTDALIEWARLEGAQPSESEWKSGRAARGRWQREYPRWPAAHVARRLFGSWSAALQAAGFAARPTSFSEQEIIDALRADARRRGRPPYVKEWSRRPAQLPGRGAVIAHFGSWTNGLRAAGLRSPQEKNRWTRETTILAARQDAAERGRPPRQAEWPRSTDTYPSAAIAARLFGSWNEMLLAAQLPAIPRGGATSAQRTRREREMLRALKAAARELGETFARPSYQKLAHSRGWPSQSEISRHFGSWPAACAAASVNRPRRTDVDDVELLALLRADAASRGRAPHKSEWQRAAHNRPTSGTITDRFGTWTAALQAAGLSRAQPVPSPPQQSVNGRSRRTRAGVTGRAKPPTQPFRHDAPSPPPVRSRTARRATSSAQ